MTRLIVSALFLIAVVSPALAARIKHVNKASATRLGPSRESVNVTSNSSGPVTIKVAHGESLSDYEWKQRRDFVVYINAGGYCCTGTIAGNVVLTAAHCVSGKTISSLSVRTCNTRSIRVTKVEIHPSYDDVWKDNDVALLWLESSHSHTKNVYLYSKTLSVGDWCGLAGFGKTHQKGCGSLHDSGWLNIESCPGYGSSIACAGSGTGSGTGSCGGDSGGPWYRASSDWNTFYVVGVNSFGVNGDCGDNSKQTGMIKTASVRSWIDSFSTPFRWSSR